MIGAEPAIIRAAPLYGSVVPHGHFWRFNEDLATAPIVANVISDQDSLHTVLRTTLEQQNLVVLEHNLRFNLAETR